MDRSIATLELEAMVLVRHLTLASSRCEASNLDRSAYTILSCLTCGGSMTLAQLSDTIGLDTSTLHRQTAAMLRTGLIERIPDPDGGLARKFVVTAEGERQLSEACRENMGRLMRATADWSAAELDVFAGYLTRFNQAIEAADQRPWPRPLAGETNDQSQQEPRAETDATAPLGAREGAAR